MSGLDYNVKILKPVTPEEILKDIEKWPPEVVKAAFASMAAAFYSYNWNELKSEIKKEMKEVEIVLQ